MAIQRITCPECGAGLKSADGFAVGQEVECPKCATEFQVEQPVAAKTTALAPSKTKSLSKKTSKLAAGDDDEDDRPKKKKKKKSAADEDEWSYKTSWIRYAVLGVLLVVMAVLGYMLYDKRKKAKEDAAGPAPDAEGRGGNPTIRGPVDPRIRPQGLPNPDQAGPAGGAGGNLKGGVPNGGSPPKAGGGVTPKGGFAPSPQLPTGIPLMDSKVPTKEELEQKKVALRTRLMGAWQADLGGGKSQTVTYTADGKFTEAGAAERAGTWQILELIGTRGLVLTRTGGGPREVSAVFEGDELIHDTGEPGVSAVFRKK